MWFKCPHCGKRFQVQGDLARKSAEFYAQFKDHTEEKQVGVCDSCWTTATGLNEPIESHERPPFPENR